MIISNSARLHGQTDEFFFFFSSFYRHFKRIPVRLRCGFDTEFISPIQTTVGADCCLTSNFNVTRNTDIFTINVYSNRIHVIVHYFRVGIRKRTCGTDNMCLNVYA